MPIFYDLFQSPPNQNTKEGEEKTLMHARIVESKTHYTKRIENSISYSSSLTPIDVSATLKALSKYIHDTLMEGDRIHLDGIGTFSISLKSHLVDSDKKKKNYKVGFKRVNFQPDAELNKSLKNIRPERLPIHRRREAISPEDRLTILKSALKDDPFITINYYRHLTGVTAYRAEKDMQKYVEEGILICRKMGKNKFYYRTLEK